MYKKVIDLFANNLVTKDAAYRMAVELAKQNPAEFLRLFHLQTEPDPKQVFISELQRRPWGKIEAIKEARSRFEMGLKEAKDFVEDAAERYGIRWTVQPW